MMIICKAEHISILHRLSQVIQFGDVASWVAGLGTVLAAFMAVYQYRANSKRRIYELHIDQAQNISSWIADNNGRSAWHAIKNSSDNPIYEVIVTLAAFQGAGNDNPAFEFREFLSVVPPGTFYARTAGNTGMSFHPSSKIAFTDSNGNSWERDGDGTLKEIEQKPMEHYNIPRPIGWAKPLSDIPR